MSATDQSGTTEMIEKMSNVEDLVRLAKIAESAERYDDMAKAMNRVTKLAGSLDETCRNLLSVAYKNVVGCRRSSWRVIRSVEPKAENKRRMELAENFRENVEKELHETCTEVLDLLKDCLIKDSCTPEEKVFYLKMRGDYWRYIAEYKISGDNDSVVACAETAYSEALEHAKTHMKPAHPNRLGLALNFSVFYYEIQKSPDKACQLAKEAFELAISDIEEHQPDDTYKDSTLIMQLLRDNLTLWTAKVDDNDENGDEL